MRLPELLERAINTTSRSMVWLAATGMVLLMLATTGDVFLRYAFNRPITGAFEFINYMMILGVYGAIAWTAVREGHVKVDLVVGRFPSRVQHFFASITYILGLGIVSIMAWQGIDEALYAMETKRTPYILPWPEFPFYLFLAIGFVLLGLVLVVKVVHSIRKAVKAPNEST
ncbi:TRAP transporter small permease [Chloroflexota bacterium]